MVLVMVMVVMVVVWVCLETCSKRKTAIVSFNLSICSSNAHNGWNWDGAKDQELGT